MEIQEKILWEERLKMRDNWIWQLVIVSSLSGIGVMTGFFISEREKWYIILIPLLLIGGMDALVVALLRSMKLDLAITRSGFYYKMWPPARSFRSIAWSEVQEIRFVKPPLPGYGKKVKWKYGTLYLMSMKKEKGLELLLRNGKKMFFTTLQPDAVRSILQKAEIKVPVINS